MTSDKSVPSFFVAQESSKLVLATIAYEEGFIEVAQRVLPLIASLQHKNRKIRNEAVSGLERLGDRLAVDPLIAALKDSDWEVRQGAIRALGTLGDTRAVEPLLQLLKTFHEANPRYLNHHEAILSSLGKLADLRAVEPVLALAEDPTCEMKYAIAKALGMLGDRRAVASLVRMLSGDTERLNAAEALGRLGDPSAVAPIVAAMQQEQKYTIRPMIVALGKIGDPRAIAPLTDELAKRSYLKSDGVCLRTLAQLKAVSALIEYLKDRDPYVRRGGVEALLEVGDPGAEREALIQALTEASQDPKSFVRSVAKKALRNLGVKVPRKG